MKKIIEVYSFGCVGGIYPNASENNILSNLSLTWKELLKIP